MNVLTGALGKFFSTDAIVSRLLRAIFIAISTVTAMGHFPANSREWSAVIAAFIAGLIGAGQNNPTETPSKS